MLRSFTGSTVISHSSRGENLESRKSPSNGNKLMQNVQPKPFRRPEPKRLEGLAPQQKSVTVALHDTGRHQRPHKMDRNNDGLLQQEPTTCDF